MNIQSLGDRDGKLRENWYIACLSSEIEGHTPQRRIIYDVALVFFRNSGGQMVALEDRCLHRHAKLSDGVVVNGQICCPYHGWVYSSEGEVVFVPSRNSCPGAGTCGRLRAFSCYEQDGCVWVWLGQGLAPAQEKPPFRFPHYHSAGWRSYFMVTDFDNEVTNLAENFMDVPHTVFVHKGWFRSPRRINVPFSITTTRGQVSVEYQQANDAIGFTRWFLNPMNKPMVHTDKFIMPNITRVDYTFGDNGFVISSQCTPVSTLKSRVYTEIAYCIGTIGFALGPLLKFYTRRVIQQDVEIMKNQGDNLQLNFKTNFHNTEADSIHREIEHLREMGVRGENYLSYAKAENYEMWI
jgi:phenylpropionate dioxygenase-like ring-hydroxylating dioxygenase large terminal subunit